MGTVQVNLIVLTTLKPLFGSLSPQTMSGVLGHIQVDRLEVKGHEILLSLSIVHLQQCQGLGSNEDRTRTLLHMFGCFFLVLSFNFCLVLAGCN